MRCEPREDGDGVLRCPSGTHPPRPRTSTPTASVGDTRRTMASVEASEAGLLRLRLEIAQQTALLAVTANASAVAATIAEVRRHAGAMRRLAATKGTRR